MPFILPFLAATESGSPTISPFQINYEINSESKNAASHTAIARENDLRLFAEPIDPSERRQLRSKVPL
jgi:hypothetical protein